MFDKNYIHLVFRRALKQDEYFRIYLFEDELVFVKLAGQFYHQDSLFQSGLLIPLFVIPYKIAQARLEKRIDAVEQCLQKEGVKGLLKDKRNFRLERSEIWQVQATGQNGSFRNAIVSNYEFHVDFLLKNGEKHKMAVAFGESNLFVRRKLQEFGYL